MNKDIVENLRKKNILILGFARSGYKAALVLNKLGINVKISTLDDLSDSKEARELRKKGIEIISGSHPLALLEDTDLIVKNPGIPYQIEFLKQAAEKNIEIITEIELASIMYQHNIVAITGTNGKTTTTSLIYEIFKQEKNNVYLAGNIGYPAIEVADSTEANANIIMEVSSFQLNGTNNFKPHIAVITNLGEAHLDYHMSKEAYHDIKKRIYKNQEANDYLILNYKDKDLHNNDIKPKVIYYTIDNDKNAAAYVENDQVIFNKEVIFDIKKLSLPGEHNLENAINAAIVAKLSNISNHSIREVLYHFKGVKHRLQFVGEHKKVKYYNDSKATNPESTVKALSGFEKNIILIAGGKDRGIDFHQLVPYFSKIKSIICVGESKEILYNLAKSNNVTSHMANKVADATLLASNIAQGNDIILLSPACASWDQYNSFEERGDEFITSFENIKSKE